MSSSNTSTVETDAIVNASRIFYQSWSYLLICLGTIGHSLSVYVFTRPTLRSNPCVRYFFAATISGLVVTWINLPLRLSQTMYNRDAFGYSTASCKILTFIVTWSRYLALSYEKENDTFFVAYLELKRLGLSPSPLSIGKYFHY